MFNKKVLLSALVVWSITIVLSYYFFGSFNPIQVFYSNSSIFAKIIMGIFLFASVMNFISLIQIMIIIPLLQIIYGEKLCPICGKNLLKFASVYGTPINCWTCFKRGKNTQYHELCYKANQKCPECEKFNSLPDYDSEYNL